MNNGGDVLARGARKANFPAAGGKVTQEKWDAIWADDETPVEEKGTKKKITRSEA
jgi:hypothetical protein